MIVCLSSSGFTIGEPCCPHARLHGHTEYLHEKYELAAWCTNCVPLDECLCYYLKDPSGEIWVSVRTVCRLSPASPYWNVHLAAAQLFRDASPACTVHTSMPSHCNIEWRIYLCGLKWLNIFLSDSQKICTYLIYTPFSILSPFPFSAPTSIFDYNIVAWRAASAGSVVNGDPRGQWGHPSPSPLPSPTCAGLILFRDIRQQYIKHFSW